MIPAPSTWSKRFLAAMALSLATSCAGGGGSLPAVTNGGGLASASVSIVVPPPQAGASAKMRHIQSAAINTNGLLVNVYTFPKASFPVPISTTTYDVSNSSALCVAAGGGRNCTFAISIPAGTYDFTVASYDLAPVAGSIPGTAKQIGWAISTNKVVTLGATNTVSFTINGVVSSVTVSAPLTVIEPLTNATQHLTVAALDAAKNVIIADNYVDASGNTVTINLSANNSPTISLSPTSLTAPAPNGVTATYTVGNIPSSLASAPYTVTITATPSSGTAGTAPISVLQEFAEYTIPTASTAPIGITKGSDNRVWFTENATSKLGAITTAGVITEYVAAGTGGGGISTCFSGNVCYNTTGSNIFGFMPTSGGGGALSGGLGSGGYGVTYDNASLSYFTQFSANFIGTITSGGVLTNYTIPTAGAQPMGIVWGPDNRAWFTENGTNKIGAMDSSGTFTEYAIPTAASGPRFIAVGSDNRMWFTEFSVNKIGAITTAGVITEYTIPTGGSQPLGITSNPDGRLWFTEYATNKVGAVTTSGTFTEFAIPTAGSGPYGITSGADGHVWFAENSSNKIATIK
jgi:virginiamycin B lyase